MPSRGMALRSGRARSLPAARLRSAAQPSQVATVLRDYVFAEAPAPVQIPYSWLSPPVRFRAEAVVNVAEIGQVDGATATVTNEASRSAYGERAVQGTLDTACDADPANLGLWLTTYRGEPRMRMPALVLVDLIARTPEECVRILRVREGDRVLITGLPWETATVTDTFGRSVSPGWGNTETGQPWVNTGGSASDHSVAGGLGLHSLAAVNASRWSTIAGQPANLRVSATVATDVLATGGSHFEALAARFTDTDNTYLARLEFTTAQVVNLTLRKRVGAVESIIGSAVDTGLTHVANTRYGVMLEVEGGTLRAKAWLDGGPVPDSWQTTQTDPDISAAGSAGMRSILSSANTNTLPVTASWDNLRINALSTWPQGANSLVVEGVAFTSQAGERKVSWVTSAVAGTVPGVPGPWFRWGSSAYGGTDVIPF